MIKKINNAKILHDKVRGIILKEWDPIGIKDFPEAQNEYDAYISSICDLLTSEKSEHEIFNYLWLIETEHIGLSGDEQHTRLIAKRLAELIIAGK